MTPRTQTESTKVATDRKYLSSRKRRHLTASISPASIKYLDIFSAVLDYFHCGSNKTGENRLYSKPLRLSDWVRRESRALESSHAPIEKRITRYCANSHDALS